MSRVSVGMALQPGDPREVGGYRVERRLGEGGQGVVYLGSAADGSRVAIKQLRTGLVADTRARTQLAKEVAAAEQVAPFCTARVIDARMDVAHPYVVSEFIDGPSLQQRVREQGPVTGPALDRLAIGTATALAAIHAAGVVHRDFKPGNVMLAEDGPRVIDFGIARDLSTETTATSKVFGTPAYMAPEQVNGDRARPATDVFAWASTMMFAATGRSPFEAEHMMAIVYRITSGEPDLAGVPEPLASVLRRCLAKDPEQRPSAQQTLQLLLGRPLPDQDRSDPTEVLAQATRIALAAAPLPPTAGTRPLGSQQPPPTRVQPAATQQFAAPPVQPPPYRQPYPQQSPPPPPRKSGKGWVAAAAVVALLLVGGVAAYAGGLFGGSGDGTDPSGTGTPTSQPAETRSEPAGEQSTEAPETTTEAPETTTEAPEEEIDPRTVPEAFNGVWSGTASQPNGEVPEWDISIRLVRGLKTGLFSSDQLGCSGRVTVDEATEGELRLRQRTDLNPQGTCVESADVTLTLDGDDQVRFAWQDSKEEDNTAEGTLARTG